MLAEQWWLVPQNSYSCHNDLNIYSEWKDHFLCGWRTRWPTCLMIWGGFIDSERLPTTSENSKGRSFSQGRRRCSYLYMTSCQAGGCTWGDTCISGRSRCPRSCAGSLRCRGCKSLRVTYREKRTWSAPSWRDWSVCLCVLDVVLILYFLTSVTELKNCR